MPHRRKILGFIYFFLLFSAPMLFAADPLLDEMNAMVAPHGATLNDLSQRQINTLSLALDGDSPASFLQRVQLASSVIFDLEKNKNAPRVSYGAPRVSLEAQIFCPIFNVYRRSFRRDHRNSGQALADHLMLKSGGPCGSGLLRYVNVESPLRDQYSLTFELQKKLEQRFQDGSFRSRGEQLSYLLEVKAKPQGLLNILLNMFRSPQMHQTLLRDYKRRSLGFDIIAGLEAIYDAIQNEPESYTQALRVLSNYDVYATMPRTAESGVLIRKGLRSQAIDFEFLLHAPPRANSSRASAAFDQAVLSIRRIGDERRSDVELFFGEAKLVRDVELEGTWKLVVEQALRSISRSIEKHANALAQTGIGSMYGNNSSFAKMSPEAKALFIEQNKMIGTYPEMPTETSCIGFVQNQLRFAYTRAGLGTRWAEIDRIVAHSNGQGTYLLDELRKDGWKIVYWNPDARNPTNRVLYPSKEADHHIWTFAMARDGKGYMPGVLSYGKIFDGLPIDFLALNYRPTDPRQTPTNLIAGEFLKNLPFFVGIANGGYHVFLGANGMVIESHSTRSPTDQTNIEVRPFNQFGLLRGESYLSGVIAVPPGPWIESLSNRLIGEP